MTLISIVPEIIDAQYVDSAERIKYIMPARYFGTLEYMLNTRHQETIRSWLCYILGREFDAVRCRHYSVEGSQGHIVVSLEFSDPWYMSQTSHRKYIEHGTLPNPSE